MITSRRELLKLGGALLLPVTGERAEGKPPCREAAVSVPEPRIQGTPLVLALTDAFMEFAWKIKVFTGQDLEAMELPCGLYTAMIHELLDAQRLGFVTPATLKPGDVRVAGIKVTPGPIPEYGRRFWEEMTPALAAYARMHGGSVKLDWVEPLRLSARELYSRPLLHLKTVTVSVESGL